MINQPSNVQHSAACLTLVVVLLGSSVARAEVSFKPRIGASATWTDNIALSASSDERSSEYILQLVPGFRLTQDAARMHSYVDYTLQKLFYTENSDRDSTFHQLDADTTIEAVREYFFVSALATYTQTLIDPALPTNSQNLFNVGNVTNAVSARVTPYFRHEFGAVLVDARYTRGFVDYRDRDAFGNEIQDTVNEEAQATIGSADPDQRLSWELHYEQQKAEYDSASRFQFDTAEAQLGFALGPALRLLARGGVESDLTQDITGGGLDSSFWQAGFRWRPNAADQLELMGGERFFGTSFRGSFLHTGRLLQMELSYSEEPTTAAQSLALRPASGGAVTPILPGSGDFVRLTSEIYVSKDFAGHLTLVGRRTRIAVNVFDSRREYLVSKIQEQVRGAGFDLQRQLNSRNTLAFSGQLQRYELRQGLNSDDTEVSLALRRILTASMSASLAVSHLERQADLNGYRANRVTLRFDKEF